ncbi:hypothetical protein [Pontimicrobium sp. IMCC45349]|uniref:hypothetical protein n=1 Tax=Pontimicrobium sp. IMCC45349 TaxID=3391574 RepID=UPI00399F9921
MQVLIKHIIIKVSLLVIVFTLLAPSFVKLAHAFENHEHFACETPNKLHIHDLEIDCEIYKFKLNTQTLSITNNFEIDIPETNYQKIISQYTCISKYQRLQCNLRGPPSLV